MDMISKYASYPPRMLDVHQRYVKNAGDENEREDNVIGKMKRRVPLDLEREIRFPYRGKHFPCSLDRSFCPAELLRFQRIDLRRQLCRRRNIFQELEFPSAQLCTIT